MRWVFFCQDSHKKRNHRQNRQWWNKTTLNCCNMKHMRCDYREKDTHSTTWKRLTVESFLQHVAMLLINSHYSRAKAMKNVFFSTVVTSEFWWFSWTKTNQSLTTAASSTHTWHTSWLFPPSFSKNSVHTVKNKPLFIHMKMQKRSWSAVKSMPNQHNITLMLANQKPWEKIYYQ